MVAKVAILGGCATSAWTFLARSALAVSTADGRFRSAPALEDMAEVAGRAADGVPTTTALMSRAVLKGAKRQGK